MENAVRLLENFFRRDGVNIYSAAGLGEAGVPCLPGRANGAGEGDVKLGVQPSRCSQRVAGSGQSCRVLELGQSLT